ncbi:MAG: FAD:protein FMN transferase [Saprospiraceae bacterium]|nr:FAD:protein FMN transferase [Saprospiraceae bacterium]
MKYFFCYSSLLILIACDSTTAEEKYLEIAGETMGTYYHITFGAQDKYPEKSDLDRWLKDLNQALSTYVENSTISDFNRSDRGISVADIADKKLATYFFENIKISREIFKKSNGFFDPTVMPLVNYWGFGYDHNQPLTVIDTQKVDSLEQFVGFEKLQISSDKPTVSKSNPGIELDFSAVAKGYAIDVVSHLLEDSFDIHDYLVDIGGESRASGVNSEGNVWRIGISEPMENSPLNSYKFIVQLKDKSIATSGNYRNFYEVGGRKISHTMNPKTGFFERNDLLSASIMTDECGYADGYATACMAMGFDAARKMIESDAHLNAIFIYIDTDNQIKHYITPQIREFVTSSN